MRNYESMIESGDWPPTNRETIRMMVGWAIGFLMGIGAVWLVVR